jgi:hypothetical protein
MDIPTDMTPWPSDNQMTEVIELLKFLAKFLLALMPALTLLKNDVDRMYVLDLFLLKFDRALCRMRLSEGYAPSGIFRKLVPLTDDKVLEIVSRLEEAASFASSIKPLLTMTKSAEICESMLQLFKHELKKIQRDVFVDKPPAPPPAPPPMVPSESPMVPSESPMVPSESPVVPPALPDANHVGRSYTGRAAPPKPKRHVSFSIDLASLSVAERNVLAQEAMESEEFDSSQYY